MFFTLIYYPMVAHVFHFIKYTLRRYNIIQCKSTGLEAAIKLLVKLTLGRRDFTPAST